MEIITEKGCVGKSRTAALKCFEINLVPSNGKVATAPTAYGADDLASLGNSQEISIREMTSCLGH